MLLCSSILSSSRENQRSAQEVPRRISSAVAGEVFAQFKTYQVPITNSSPSHYIIFHLPLIFLSPTSPLPFYSPSLFVRLFFACFLFARVLDCLLVTMAQDNTKLCDFANTKNNDFISTPIAPLTDGESCEINAALLNLVMEDPVLAFLPKMPLPI